MERGEIRWVTFKAPDKRRPVLILTRQKLIPRLNELVVAPLTTTLRTTPSHVVVGPREGLPQTCDIKLDNLVSVERTRIGSLICTLSVARMAEVEKSIRYALGMDDQDAR